MTQIVGVSCGISYIHSSIPPIIHGDIKGVRPLKASSCHPLTINVLFPQLNILIKADGTPMLADFGSCRIRHELTRSKTVSSARGTHRWTAPEIFRGDKVEPPADCYAFSMTIFELATDSVPFAEIDNRFTLERMVMDGHRPCRPVPSFIEDRLWGLMQEMWADGTNSPPRPTAKVVKMRLEDWRANQ